MSDIDGAAAFDWVKDAGGLGDVTGLLGNRKDKHHGIDIPVAVTTCLKTGAAIASGVGTFSAAAGPYGAIGATALGSVASAVEGGVSAYNTQKTVAKLKKLYERARRVDKELAENIAWLLRKQERKRDKSIANATVVAQPGVMAYRAVRAIHKWRTNTKGVSREEKANYFYENAKSGSGEVQKIAAEVVHAVVEMDYEKLAKKALADAFKSDSSG